MFKLFSLVSIGVLLVFFSYKSVLYLSYPKVEGNVIRLEKTNLKYLNVRSNQYSDSKKSYSYEWVTAPVISYKYKSEEYIVLNPFWGKANDLKVKDKVVLLIDSKNDELHLVTLTHFWLTSNDIIIVFSLIFLLTILFSIFQKEKKVSKPPHPLFDRENI